MNTTIREKDGKWQIIISYKDRSGRWKQKAKQGFKTKQEAKKYTPTLIKEIGDSKQLNIDFENIKVEEFIEIWLEDKELNLSPNSRRLYKRNLAKLDPIKDKRMKDVEYFDLAIIFTELQKNLKSASVQSVYVVVKSFFKSAVNPFKIRSDNPMDSISVNAVSSKEKSTLTKSEIDDLISKLNNNHKVIAAFAGYCGLRYGEILGITWSDINFKSRTIKINKQWNLTGENEYGFKKTKTSNSDRTVPFPEKLYRILMDFRQSKGNVIQISQRLFYTINNSNTSYLNEILQRQVKGITIHQLRHSYATILLSEGLDIKTVAALLGDTVSTVIKTYIHYTEDMRKNAADRISQIF